MKRADDERHLESQSVEEAAPGARGPRWLPEDHDPTIADAPWEALRYVVVDDVYDDAVLLIGSMWPAVTEAGTLYFGEDPRLAVLAGEDVAGWRDSAPGMPLVLTTDDQVVDEAMSAGPRGGEPWMLRTSLQDAVDAARDGADGVRLEIAGGEDPAPEDHRPLRIGDTFAVVIREPEGASIVATSETPPTEYVSVHGADLIDITRQARSVAKAAQLAAISPPVPAQRLDAEIEATAAEARVWEMDGDTEVPTGEIETADPGDDPRDARPTV